VSTVAFNSAQINMYSLNTFAWYKTTVWNQLNGSTVSSSLSNTNFCCQTASIRLGYFTKSIRFYIHRPMNWTSLRSKNKINVDGKGHLQTPRSKNSHIQWKFFHIQARFVSGTVTQIPTRFGIEFIAQTPIFATHKHTQKHTNK
jgi:hypothetical protein